MKYNVRFKEYEANISSYSDNNQIFNLMKTDINESFFDKLIYGKIDEMKIIYNDSKLYINLIIANFNSVIYTLCN